MTRSGSWYDGASGYESGNLSFRYVIRLLLVTFLFMESVGI